MLAAAEGDLPDAAAGTDVGHVHLKVANVEQAVAFWTQEVGMELMARYGADAAFIADGGYHHHVGANSWYSRGARARAAGRARPGPRRRSPGALARTLVTPDGVEIVFEA